MGRYLGPKDKLSRREGVNLFDKTKSPLTKRNYPPGVHGPSGRGRLTTYGAQLREKQKAKRIYGIFEKQFINYYKKALSKKGNTGQIMIEFLETRLDNIVYRSGLADSRAQARQLVNHAWFLVNDKPVDIPSYQCKVGDLVKIKKTKQEKKLIKDLLKKFSNKSELPDWVSFDPKSMTIKLLTLPKIDEKSLLFDIRSIIEFYSK